ncbi:MAG: PEP-utilizing enzyme, partial [Gammaproteobacteria bacterium]
FVKSRLSLFEVPDLLMFEVSEFERNPTRVLQKIQSRFVERTLVIRSSAADEDGKQHAMAGEYDSVLNVSSTIEKDIAGAIDRVIASYKRNGRRSSGDEFIVQEMLVDTSMSGVVFTHDLNTGAPYYVINYDDVSGLTDTVTSGGGEYSNRTLYIHRGASESIRSERFRILLAAIQELESLLGSADLDIEFALGRDMTPFLLQVRPITTQKSWNRFVGERIDSALQSIQDFIRVRMQPMPGVFGRSTVLGQMPDWNPAEMIGRAPRALAYSLYRCLITDNAWRIARQKMGYASPAGQPLMVSLAGQPFIDTRLSFHSYLPAGLSADVAEKLVNAWVKRLREHPELHDKVEFDVAITTYSFDFDFRLERLKRCGISDAQFSEYKELSRNQTRNLLADRDEGGISHALADIKELANRQDRYASATEERGISGLFEMIDDCIQFGTVPFSILARHGFIAQTLLQSLNRVGILSEDDIQNIQSGIRTVASDLVDDMRRMQMGELPRAEVMSKYGHLRPGTYDILSQRYDQMPEFGSRANEAAVAQTRGKFELDAGKRARIDALLLAEGFDGFDTGDLLTYIQNATAGREFGKFVFTRSVSDMLEQIAAFGEQHGLSRDEMSHLRVDSLFDVATSSGEGSIQQRLRQIAQTEKEKHELSVAIRLPQILFDEAGVHVVPFQVSHPNFITRKKITAESVHLHTDGPAPSLAARIVLIENADPGFDWIFSQNIGGLITKYGGANSHMAIRCAEFGIPAAIGCGEQRFDLLTRAEQIDLDCAAGLINVVH